MSTLASATLFCSLKDTHSHLEVFGMCSKAAQEGTLTTTKRVPGLDPCSPTLNLLASEYIQSYMCSLVLLLAI